MGFRFRRSVRLLPGVRVNFGMRGPSLSVGGRGARLTFGPNGARASVGIPGTGISYSERIDAGHLRRREDLARRRADRERARIEDERRRLAEAERRAEALADCKVKLNPDGSLDMVDAFGQPLSRADVRRAWEQHGEGLARWLEEHVAEINREADRLTRVHEDTPAPTTEPFFPREPFGERRPEPDFPERFAEPEPEPPSPRERGILHRLLPWWLGRRLERENTAARRRHEEEAAAWRARRDAWQAEHDRALAAWREAIEGWEARRRRHEEDQDRLEAERRHALATDAEAMEAALGEALGMLAWPLETEVDFAVDEDGATAWLDVDLPEIEDVPPRTAAISANRRRLHIRKKPQGQLRAEYARHVHGVALRLAGIALAALPACRTVIVSGYSQRPDAATGRVVDDYLYSVAIDRARFTEIDFSALDRVDPIAALERFEMRREMSKSFVLKPVAPMVRPGASEPLSVARADPPAADARRDE